MLRDNRKWVQFCCEITRPCRWYSTLLSASIYTLVFNPLLFYSSEERWWIALASRPLMEEVSITWDPLAHTTSMAIPCESPQIKSSHKYDHMGFFFWAAHLVITRLPHSWKSSSRQSSHLHPLYILWYHPLMTLWFGVRGTRCCHIFFTFNWFYFNFCAGESN